MLMTPNGKTLNVGDWDSGTVTPICTAANTALPAIRVAPPHGLDTAFAITPDGRTLYVDGGFGGSNRGFIVPVSTATGAGGRPILASGQPGVMAFTPNGMTLYVLPSGHPGPQDIIPVNTATNTAGPAIHTGCHRTRSRSPCPAHVDLGIVAPPDPLPPRPGPGQRRLHQVLSMH